MTTSLLALLLAAGEPAVPVASATAGQTAVVDASIRSQTPEQMSEEREVRRYLSGQPDADEGPMLVVRYTLAPKGGNNWTLFVAAFDLQTMQPIAHGQVGGKGLRLAELKSAKGRVVELDLKYYSESDALCCPTIQGTARYRASRGGLEECETRLRCTTSRAPRALM